MVEPSLTLVYLAIGAVVGAAGQGGRAVIGIEKSKQEATDQEIEDDSWWDPRRLYLSLFIGAVAGVLFVALRMEWVEKVGTQDLLFALVGVGYAGTDFIEGILKGRGRQPGSGGGGGSGGDGDGSAS